MQRSLAADFYRYVGALSEGQWKPQRKFVRDMVFGLIEARSPMLSNIGRALDEPCRLIHTEKRLSRNLGSERLDDDRLREHFLKFVRHHLHDRRYRTPTIAVDSTDIQKPSGKKMPFLDLVRDGSKGKRDGKPVVGPGYYMTSIEAAGDHGRRLPLWWRVFSLKDPEVRSQSQVTREAIARVRRYVPDDAIWVFDRGFESHDFFRFLDDQKLRWAIRLTVGKWKPIYNGARTSLNDIAECVRLGRPFKSRKQNPETKSRWNLRVGATRVGLSRQRGRGNSSVYAEYYLVVVEGIGESPMVLLTNVNVSKCADLHNVVNCYLERWSVEEKYRFCKQELRLEEMRAMTWRGLQRLGLLVMLAYGFLASVVHDGRDRAELIAQVHKSFGPPPAYLAYRLIFAIGRLLRPVFRGRAGP